MESQKTKCRVCNVEFLVATANRTGGICMRCFKNDRYHHLAILSIEEFFSRATDDGCSLTPNLEQPLSNAVMKARLLELRSQPGVTDLLIPVNEYEDPDAEREPSSDRIFILGSIDKQTVVRWAGN